MGPNNDIPSKVEESRDHFCEACRRLTVLDTHRTATSSFQIRRKIYVSGKLHPDVRVPFREISLAPTKTMNGEIEINEPVRVYDTSGPWGDPDFHGDVTQGLPPLRAKWIRERGDVEEINGREVQPIDDGFLSEKHAAIAAQRSTPNAQRPTFNGAGAPSRRRPLRASAGHPVTQLAYAQARHHHARNGIHRDSREPGPRCSRDR